MSREAAGGEVTDLAAAYAELQRLLLDGPDLVSFLQQVTRLATWVVPASSCGITMLRGADVAMVATSDDLAAAVDESQDGAQDGPCREALRVGAPITIDDLELDRRWDEYRRRAIKHGVRSSVSLPLLVNGEPLGALNLYARRPGHFGAPEIGRAEAFTAQAAITVAIALRSFDRTVEEQLREALTTRAVIDQALGILMGRERVGSREAFAVLRSASQMRNRPLREIAAELIETTTGHPPDPPRPFSDPR